MANRRMILTSITQSFQFFEMTAGAQALYLALIGSADDDGIVEGKLILRTAGRRKNELKELAENGYIVILEQSSLLCWVTDWQSFNTIRAGRGHPSRYRSTLVAQVPNIKNRLFSPKTEDDRGQNDGIEQGISGLSHNMTGKTDCPPTLEELLAFVKKENLSVDPHKFYEHYESANWTTNGEPIHDWRAVCRSWNKTEYPKPKPKPKGVTYQNEKPTDYDELERKLIAQSMR